jgi:hypothetical protein
MLPYSDFTKDYTARLTATTHNDHDDVGWTSGSIIVVCDSVQSSHFSATLNRSGEQIQHTVSEYISASQVNRYCANVEQNKAAPAETQHWSQYGWTLAVSTSSSVEVMFARGCNARKERALGVHLPASQLI